MKLKRFNEHVNSNLKVYVISQDSHRDSANLKKCAIDKDGLIKLVQEEELECGFKVIVETINIDFEKELTTYKRIDTGDYDEENGRGGFFTLEVV